MKILRKLKTSIHSDEIGRTTIIVGTKLSEELPSKKNLNRLLFPMLTQSQEYHCLCSLLIPEASIHFCETISLVLLRLHKPSQEAFRIQIPNTTHFKQQPIKQASNSLSSQLTWGPLVLVNNLCAFRSTIIALPFPCTRWCHKIIPSYSYISKPLYRIISQAGQVTFKSSGYLLAVPELDRSLDDWTNIHHDRRSRRRLPSIVIVAMNFQPI